MKVSLEIALIVFYRLLGLPFVVLWAAFLTFAGMVFPFILIMGFSFIGLLTLLPIIIFRQGGADIDPMEPFIEVKGGLLLSYIVGMTIPIWSIPAITWIWLYKGKVYNPGT